MRVSELLQMIKSVGPMAANAIRTGQLFKPSCHLLPADPDVLVEYDLRIPTSEGFEVSANVFRSRAADARGEPMPVVMCAHPYDNHKIPALGQTPLGGPPQQYRIIPQEDAPTFSELTSWESPDPNFWVASGYAVVNMNLPGFANSGGPPTVFSPHQGKIYYEAIEWIAAQSWCDGNVGLNGVSFLAISQYHVAFSTAYGGAPKALKAICPWEGLVAPYHDLLRLGGIWEVGFPTFWWFTEVLHTLSGSEEDFIASEGGTPLQFRETQPTFGEWARSKVPALEAIEVPTLLCASYSDQGVHTPGGFRGFPKIGAEQKWLYTHRGLKWDAYYSREVQELTKKFFDCFVRGQRDNGWLEQPRVRVELRASRDEIVEVRGADAWPLPETDWQRWHLDGANRTLGPKSSDSAETSYDARRGSAVFEHRFEEDTEITGPMALHLWIESRADAKGRCASPLLMALVDKLDAEGKRLSFYGAVGSKSDSVSRGYLDVAERELSEEATEWLPSLTLTNPRPLGPGEPTKVAIELFPHSTWFRAGETLRLTIGGHELIASPPFTKDLSGNAGLHVIHTGGDMPSYLLVPVIPVRNRTPDGTSESAIIRKSDQ